jgi:hypothetical protein
LHDFRRFVTVPRHAHDDRVDFGNHATFDEIDGAGERRAPCGLSEDALGFREQLNGIDDLFV